MAKTIWLARYGLFAALAIYWPSIALGTHLPSQKLDDWVDLSHDKLVHFGSYLGLAFLLMWCVMFRRPTWGRTVAVFAVVLLYALLDELTQMLVPTRSAELKDWLADSAGTAVGIAFYFASWRLLESWWPRRAMDRTEGSEAVAVERS